SVYNIHYKIKCQVFYFPKLPDSAIVSICLMCSVHFLGKSQVNKIYGKANWRKLKGICKVELEDGAILDAEVHWYEGHGIGKKEIKIKRYL
ncbi:MAG: hypothetical protein AB1480_07895, partial [Nitrospirota bacterium]